MKKLIIRVAKWVIEKLSNEVVVFVRTPPTQNELYGYAIHQKLVDAAAKKKEVENGTAVKGSSE